MLKHNLRPAIPSVRLAILFSTITAVLALVVIRQGGWAWLLVWPAVSFGCVTSAYFGLGPGVFGKRADGSISWRSWILLGPYLAMAWAGWRVLRWLERGPAFARLAPDVWIGRRLLAHEYPAEIDTVVDLTCELVECRGVLSTRGYRALPTLDATAPSCVALGELVASLDGRDRTVYVHCAQGRGRTGVVAVAILLGRGTATTVDEAIRLAGVARALRFTRNQRRTLDAFAESIRGNAPSRPSHAENP